ncbi:MAG: hypothetical protein Q9175_003804 [Cornicularia normoerica]
MSALKSPTKMFPMRSYIAKALCSSTIGYIPVTMSTLVIVTATGFFPLSHNVQTGMQTVEHGTRANTSHLNAKLLDYCPCVQRTKTPSSLSLLQTCTQIHKEASMVPFESNNTFIFQETKTFAAFFGLVFSITSESNDNATFASGRSCANYNMRHVRLHSRAMISQHVLYVTRLLRAALSLLTDLQTFELTLGILLYRTSEWDINDSLFGVSRSVKKVTVKMRDAIGMAREYLVPVQAGNRRLRAAMNDRGTEGACI